VSELPLVVIDKLHLHARSWVMMVTMTILARESRTSSVDRLTVLYKTYGGQIYARCLRILNDRAAAEDATQETFVRAYRHLEKVPDSKEALHWIYRIATNYCLNQLRNRRRGPELRAEFSDAADPGFDKQVSDRDFVQSLVLRMPSKLQTVVWLRHVDGLDQEEIAGILNVSRRTVINRLSEFDRRARKFTQRMLA